MLLAGRLLDINHKIIRCNELRQNRSLRVGLIALLVLGFLHRALQLWLIWPQLASEIAVTSNNQVMELLLKEIMSEHPWWGLWFLQQTPPLPNVVWAAVLMLTQSPFCLAIIFISFQALLSCLTAVAMALLFVRFGASWWLGLTLAALFFFGSDLLLLEYSTMGQFYYEMMSMLLCVLSCHAALSLVRRESLRAALGLGVCVAGLALTRASFSYFWPPVLLWLIYVGFLRKPKLVAAFLLPVFLLHGGWALKNYYVYDYWSWSTSSWGGMNMQQGERNRNGFRFNQWVAQQPAMCKSPWHEMTASAPRYFFLMPVEWGAILPPGVVLPPEVVARDQYIADKRGTAYGLDSIVARLWAQCLLKEFSQYWRAYPQLLIRGAWRSYQIFWQPIKQFAASQPYPIRPDVDVYSEGLHWPRALGDAWQEWSKGYSIRHAPLRLAPLDSSDYSPVRIIALPFFSSFISAMNFAVLHSFPLLMFCAICWKRHIVWPRGFSFLLLIYCYLAVLSSIVEYGENMRFRIDVEPVIWVICFVIARAWFNFFPKKLVQ